MWWSQYVALSYSIYYSLHTPAVGECKEEDEGPEQKAK
jgi:hypothetical protein